MGGKLDTSPIDFVRRIVINMARRYPSHIDRDELVGAALLRWVEAKKRFDPSHGIPFEAYVTRRICGSVLDWLRRNDTVPRRARRRAIQNGETLLQLVVSNEHEVEHATDQHENVEAVMEREEESKLELERLHQGLCRLSERERQVLSLRFVNERTLEQIAREIGISNGRAAQIVWGAIYRLRAIMTGQQLPPKSVYRKKRRTRGLL